MIKKSVLGIMFYVFSKYMIFNRVKYDVYRTEYERFWR